MNTEESINPPKKEHKERMRQYGRVEDIRIRERKCRILDEATIAQMRRAYLIKWYHVCNEEFIRKHPATHKITREVGATIYWSQEGPRIKFMNGKKKMSTDPRIKTLRELMHQLYPDFILRTSDSGGRFIVELCLFAHPAGRISLSTINSAAPYAIYDARRAITIIDDSPYLALTKLVKLIAGKEINAIVYDSSFGGDRVLSTYTVDEALTLGNYLGAPDE